VKLHYPFHPLFDQRDDLEVVEIRSDMLVVRAPDGSRRGVPAWMFDPAVCHEVRKLSQPLVETGALLEIAHLLELNGQRKLSARDERNPNDETQAGIQITGDPNTPSPGRGDPAGEANPGSRKGAVRDAVCATDPSGHRVRQKSKRRAQ
jgi:hypothetical protein